MFYRKDWIERQDELKRRVMLQCPRCGAEGCCFYSRKINELMNPESPKRGRPPSEGETATGQIQARTSMSRKNAYVRAARARKMKLTEWIFEICDKAAGYCSPE